MPAQAEAVPEDIVPQDGALAEVTFAASGKTARAAETETILATARAAGIPIPSGCGMGICGTCQVQKLSGQVHMVHNGGITDEDIEAGYILACCSRPIGAVTIDL